MSAVDLVHRELLRLVWCSGLMHHVARADSLRQDHVGLTLLEVPVIVRNAVDVVDLYFCGDPTGVRNTQSKRVNFLGRVCQSSQCAR